MTKTKNLIQQTFLELAGRIPVDKITVRMLVESCGVNRNSFYYYFTDMPDLIEKTLIDLVLKESKGKPATIREVVENLLAMIEGHKDVCRNVYFSNNRYLFEKRIFELGDEMCREYLVPVLKENKIDPVSQELIVSDYKCSIVGHLSEWMNGNMNDDFFNRFKANTLLREGILELMMEKTKEESYQKFIRENLKNQ